MTKANNKTIKMMVYMEEDEKESLLGKEDPVKLGIIKLDPKGEGPYNNNDRLRCVIPEGGRHRFGR